MKKSLEEIAGECGCYNAGALKFVFDGLGHTIQQIRQEEEDEMAPRHITGAELAEGLADMAKQRWGRLAKMVLNQWGIKGTRDFGEIVYLMIEHGWMTSQETDQIEDFNNVYDFEQVFEKQFEFDMG